jgi:class 3 adenylate cyclase
MNTGKSAFLLVSMVPWLLVGGALIYLSPQMADAIMHSEMTATWLKTLNRSGYYPNLAIGVALGMSIVGTGLSIFGATVLKPKL